MTGHGGLLALLDGREPVATTDVDGWEVSSCVRSIDGALAVADDLCRLFLELLRARA